MILYVQKTPFVSQHFEICTLSYEDDDYRVDRRAWMELASCGDREPSDEEWISTGSGSESGSR